VATTPWTPWHKVVTVRDDVRSGELSLTQFAADLYDVAVGKAQPIYQNPREFFALTYPTAALRDLARDVTLRLAGKTDKAIRQLELTYGGGKTHALITLYHLAHDPAHLPTDLPATQEFIQHIGFTPPRARIAVLAFDKLDTEKGMEIAAPNGERRWLKQPWSVLAWQLAGEQGLRILHPDDLPEERESAPAENLLAEVLAIPAREGHATLILMDEVLMYAREKVGSDSRWRGTLLNFFQYLTQAVVKAPRCALVASLLATDPRKSDELGKAVAADIYQIFKREGEESVTPVQKDDAAEVLRRRFFTPESIRDRNAFRPHVVAAAQGIFTLDEQSARERSATEEQLLASYPFHPALTDIFYTKWTNLEGFQRTRGVLRTFALALRDAEAWDESPLIGANVFLSAPGAEALSDAARELTTIAATEEYEGKRQAWPEILEGELARARDVQQEYPHLSHREVEQAVFGVFLHSQPIGQKASTRDLMVLLGPTKPDKINLEKALKGWATISWFLDESGMAGIGEALPTSWRLGSKPNLRQMHHEARQRIQQELVTPLLLDRITEFGKAKNLGEDARTAGVRLHVLPKAPNDVEDDGAFHFAVLGPAAASSAGTPSREAVRYLTETTSSERPRVNRNAVILVVPSSEGLDAARNAIGDALAWQEVQAQIEKQGQDIDPIRLATLDAELKKAQDRIPQTIRQAYCVVVTMNKDGQPEAFKVTPGAEAESLFKTVKDDKRTGIREKPISADALLPGGPYDLWREGEPSRRVKDLVGAFAQNPRLPKMVNTEATYQTLIAGCRDGLFVLQLQRPDHSYRTFWREEVDQATLRDLTAEAVLPESATLTSLQPSLLAPNVLPGLWHEPVLTFINVCDYFRGGHVIQVDKGGYSEDVAIPHASRETLEQAVASAVRAGDLWLMDGQASFYQEDVPVGMVSDGAILMAPPQPIKPQDILAQNLPEAWSEAGETTAKAIADALDTQTGKRLPWTIVQSAITSAFNARYLERTPESGPWPCDAGGAAAVRIRMPGASSVTSAVATHIAEAPLAYAPLSQMTPTQPGVLVAEAILRPNELQELADQIGELTRLATEAGAELTFHIRIEVSGADTQGLAPDLNDVLGGVKRGFRLR